MTSVPAQNPAPTVNQAKPMGTSIRLGLEPRKRVLLIPCDPLVLTQTPS